MNIIIKNNKVMIKLSKIDIESLSPMKKYISDHNNPKYFFTMTSVNKIGINPQSPYNSTPLAICAYPLSEKYYKMLINNTLPFAGYKEHIQVFNITNKVNLVSEYSEYDLNRDIDKLKIIFKDQKLELNKYIDKYIDETDPFNSLYEITKKLSKLL